MALLGGGGNIEGGALLGEEGAFPALTCQNLSPSLCLGCHEMNCSASSHPFIHHNVLPCLRSKAMEPAHHGLKAPKLLTKISPSSF
jgi:hypothetical protein